MQVVAHDGGAPNVASVVSAECNGMMSSTLQSRICRMRRSSARPKGSGLGFVAAVEDASARRGSVRAGSGIWSSVCRSARRSRTRWRVDAKASSSRALDGGACASGKAGGLIEDVLRVPGGPLGRLWTVGLSEVGYHASHTLRAAAAVAGREADALTRWWQVRLMASTRRSNG